MSQALLEKLRKYLELYPVVDREKWEAGRLNAIKQISAALNKKQIQEQDLELFEDFWVAYPKRHDKPGAKRAWVAVAKERPPLATLISAIRKQEQSETWMKGFIPHPSAWLRGHRWADEMEVKLTGVVNEKPWHETASGIEEKGKELGIMPHDFESFPHFKIAVMRAAMKAA